MNLKTAKDVINKEIKALELLKSSINKDFEKIVEVLLNTKGKVVVSGMGKSGHVAKKISSTFSSIGTPSFFIHPGEANHGDLGMISARETIILISNSGETPELSNIIIHCKKKKVPIISITSEINSTLAKESKYLLEIPRNIEACPLELAPTSSTTVTIVLGDALAVAMLKKRKFTKEDFGALHPGGKLGKMLLNVGAIMKKEDEIPIIDGEKKMSEAILEMTTKGLGCVGIISKNSGKLIGIITDGDLRRNMKSDLLDQRASDIMTTKPKTLGQEVLISEALKNMNKESITSFFVTKKSIPIGIVHLHDILKY